MLKGSRLDYDNGALSLKFKRAYDVINWKQNAGRLVVR